MSKDVGGRFLVPPMQHTLCQLPEPNEPGPNEWVLPDLAMVLGITDTLTGAPPRPNAFRYAHDGFHGCGNGDVSSV